MTLPVKVTADHIYIQTPYDLRDYVQSHLNGMWSKKENAYRFPKNWGVWCELKKAFPQLQASPKFMELGSKIKHARDLALSFRKATDAPGDERLRPYQRLDVQYLAKIPAAGIFNEPRTGKTPTSIMLMNKLYTKRNLVVAPASLIWNWAEEFKKWGPEFYVTVVNGSPKKRKDQYESFTYFSNKHKVLIISKDTWKADYKHFERYEFDAVFIDEAHYLRNFKTVQSKAVFAIKSKRRYALTGTPTVKHASDIYGILHFLYPSKFNSYWQFCERYFEIGEDFMGHKEISDVKPHRKEELEELIGFMSVQRKRKDVMQWLPEKERIPFYVKMNSKQQKLYDRMRDDFIAYLEKEDFEETLPEDWASEEVDTSGVLPQLMRLRQLCLDPRLLNFDVAGSKTESILEWLDDNREPVVIMSMFTSYLKLLKTEIEKLGLKVGEINGKMSNQEKHKAAEAFQTGKTDVLLCNIISAGTGFTLDRAETIVFTDKAWNPSENEQAEDRITPVTEARNHKHSIITFNCLDSFDERIHQLLSEKKSITSVINEGGINALKRLLK